LRALVEQLVPPGNAHVVIDVGCGTGGNLAILAEDYECFGIDTSTEAIDLAQRRFGGVQFFCGHAPEDLGVLMQKADVVLLMDVLEHVRDDAGLLERLVESLSPGAKLLLTVPADASLWSKHDHSFGHYRRYDEQQLCQLWDDLPVRTRMISHFNSRLYPLVRLARSWTRHREAPFGEAGTDFQQPAAPLNRWLTRLFAAEARRLVDALQDRRVGGYGRGVSLIAILERQADVPSQTEPIVPAFDDSVVTPTLETDGQSAGTSSSPLASRSRRLIMRRKVCRSHVDNCP